MSLEFKVVDAFTDKAFSGNPAAVILLPADHTYPYETLLGIAQEFNLSETAYVIVPKEKHVISGDNYPTFGLRWFTTVEEFKLCGHATLASSSVVFEDERLVPSNVHQIHLTTLAGTLTARRILSDLGPPKYEIELPASQIVPADKPTTSKVQEVVSRATSTEVAVKYVGVCPTKQYSLYMLVEIDTKVPLKDMKVHSGILGELFPPHGIVILCQETAAQGNTAGTLGFDYRTFATPMGVAEDPVCGSATSFAAKYWSSRSRPVKGVNKITSVSSRGGDLNVIWEDGMERVRIQGRARVASKGEVYL